MVRKRPAAAAGLAFGVVGAVVAAAAIIAAQLAEGKDMIKDYELEDPTPTVKARLVETLAKEAGLANMKLVEATAASDSQAERS